MGSIEESLVIRAIAIGVLMVGIGIGVRLYHHWVMPVQINNLEPIVASVASGNYQLMVQVSGAVRNPGVYTVSPTTRLVAVVKQAGGVLPGGDVSGLNFASRMTDGQHIIVPYQQVASSSGTVSISINTASALELAAIPGIGPAMAERIVLDRNRHGGYSSVESLIRVPGIGEKKLNSMKQYIRI